MDPNHQSRGVDIVPREVGFVARFIEPFEHRLRLLTHLLLKHVERDVRDLYVAPHVSAIRVAIILIMSSSSASSITSPMYSSEVSKASSTIAPMVSTSISWRGTRGCATGRGTSFLHREDLVDSHVTDSERVSQRLYARSNHPYPVDTDASCRPSETALQRVARNEQSVDGTVMISTDRRRGALRRW